jgi:cytochrome c biogenesis protein CcmG, thiol:disulfide interchange protein DsbE
MRGRVVALSAAAVVMAVGLTMWPSADSPVEGTRSSAIDVPFVFVDGSSANLADFAGSPLVVNFWASWCPACVAEMPDLESVHQLFGDEVVFLGLNMQETDPSAAATLVDRTGVTYRLGIDPDGSIFNSFGGIAMPTTVLIDADGNVVRTHAGVLFADDLEEIIRTELLAS